ncbi:exopolysaccharide biosynthesis protein [uncultured Tateyamaria sp.]|uniref:exopolysaccharide biosynthesis protein n=1 Tax=uncultured Tateyamaria sp. TaxID=455651 RepID=UPI00261D8507|nr:exopolysaccharide biosynthesis protein [uncultured Tateyamaria sp.]
MTPPDRGTLTALLDRLEGAATGDEVSVQDILNKIGDRSIMPIVLAIALVLVSPLSGIPGLPTISAIIILLVMGQALARRQHLWLPAFLRDRRLRSDRMIKSIAHMRRPAHWIDRHSHPRLRILTSGPLRLVTLLACTVVPMIWPFLELLPFVTSIGAGAVALMSFGLLTRDGLYVLWGYVVVGAMVAAILWLLQAGA